MRTHVCSRYLVSATIFAVCCAPSLSAGQSGPPPEGPLPAGSNTAAAPPANPQKGSVNEESPPKQKPSEQNPPPPSSSRGQTEGCESSLTICLNLEGKGYEDDKAPPSVRPGDILAVKVLGKIDDRSQVRVSATQQTLAQSLLPPRSADGTQALTGDVVKASEAIPVAADAAELVIQVQVQEPDGGPFNLKATLRIGVDRGEYHVRPALMFPAVFQVESVHETRLVGSRDRAISVHTDVALIPAVALNVYPCGRSNGRIRSAWSDGDFFLIQAGAGLDFSKPSAFLGIGIEFVSGFALTGGLTFLFNVNRLDDGYESGMLIDADATLPTHQGAFVTGYAGLSLSSELVESVRTLITTTRANGLP